jgi:hypothetical protein
MPTITSSEAARALGNVRSEKKAAAGRRNLAKARKKVADALAAFQQEPARAETAPRRTTLLIPAAKEKL